MKIGLLTYGLDRSVRGISRYTVELAEALADGNGSLEITLLQAGPSGPLEGKPYRKVPLPGCRWLPGLMTLGNFLLPRQARRLGLDVIHDPTGVAPFLFGAHSTKMVLTLHDVFPLSFPGNSAPLENIIYRYWLPRVIQKVDAVITPSLQSRADILRYLPVSASRLHVIPYGRSVQFHPLPKEEVKKHLAARFGLSTPYILYVGAVESRKNVCRLVEAFARLAGEFPRLRLVLAGPRIGETKTMESLLARGKISDRVLFTGPISDLAALYNGCELLIFPSLYEGFGLPPLEAMACGAPVICSNRASLPEVVGKAAWLVDPLDTEGLTKAMREVLTKTKLRRDMRKKGLQQARKFSWKRNAEETMEVYRKVVYH